MRLLSSSVRVFGAAAFAASMVVGSQFASAQNAVPDQFSMQMSAVRVGAPVTIHVEEAYPNSEWFMAADVAEGHIAVPGMPRLRIGLAVSPSFSTFPHWFAGPDGKSDFSFVAGFGYLAIGTPLYAQCYDFSPIYPAGAFSSNVEAFVVHPPAAGIGQPSRLTLSDDGSAHVSLPFAFPFYGVDYGDMYVNANGNITFQQSDAGSSTDLQLFAMGLPRIAPMLADLTPVFGRVSIDETAIPGSAFTVHFQSMRDKAAGGVNTFDVTLYSGGHVQISYDACTVDHALVGITPGSTSPTIGVDLQPGVQLFDLSESVAETFSTQHPFDLAHDVLSFLYLSGHGYVLLR